MKRSAPKVSRTKARALKLRAEANEAREAVDAFSGDPGRVAEDKSRWELLCRALEVKEKRATRAEAAAEREPGQRDREARARAAAQVAEDKSGTVLLKTRDAAALQRVACCRKCPISVDLHARSGLRVATLWAAGWGSRRDTDKPGWPRLWWCPECWVPPRLTEADPDGSSDVASYQGTDGQRVLVHVAPRLSKRATEDAARRRDSRARKRLEADVRRLAEVDPGKAEAVLQRLIFTAPTKHVGRAWRAVAAEVVK